MRNNKWLLVSVFSCFMIALCFINVVSVSASESAMQTSDIIGDGIVSASANIDTNYVYALAYNGTINDDGVRLRLKPSTTAAILEVMYTGERVTINYTTSASQSNGTWYYVKRAKTGTWGWVYYKYLIHN